MLSMKTSLSNAISDAMQSLGVEMIPENVPTIYRPATFSWSTSSHFASGLGSRRCLYNTSCSIIAFSGFLAIALATETRYRSRDHRCLQIIEIRFTVFHPPYYARRSMIWQIPIDTGTSYCKTKPRTTKAPTLAPLATLARVGVGRL